MAKDQTPDATQEPTLLSAAHCWATLPTTERNSLIAKLIGAKLLSQFYLYIDGKEYSPMPHQSHDREKAEGLAAYVKGECWAEFAAERGLKDEWRESVEAKLIEWPLRYSDTPGGGWVVVEAMRDQGWDIKIESTGDGWMITVDENNPHHGRVIEHGPTMQAAACQAALRCQWPNDKSTHGKAVG